MPETEETWEVSDEAGLEEVLNAFKGAINDLNERLGIVEALLKMSLHPEEGDIVQRLKRVEERLSIHVVSRVR